MIKKQRKSSEYQEVSGGDDWLTTYSDMMTLLVCFFVLMMGVSKVDSEAFEKIKKQMSKSFGGEFENTYEKVQLDLEKVIKEEALESVIKITSSASGVQLIFQGSLLFESGKADIKPEASNVLQKISETISSSDKELYMLVEGHTDNVPINTGIYPSNWELSAGRAARIVREFESTGFKKEKMLAVGVGETRPLTANQNEDGTPNYENMATNRRVVVKLTKETLVKNDADSDIKKTENIKAVEGASK